MMAHRPNPNPVPKRAHIPAWAQIIANNSFEDAPIVFITAFCFRVSCVNMYSMIPVTPNPTEMARESIEAMSPTSSELIKNQRTVSALKSSEVRAFRPVRA
jgi:hypothetical protein